MGTSSAWTPERRERQRQRIMRVRPWEKSTGPRTAEGKRKSSMNARRSDELLETELYLKILTLRNRLLFLLLEYDPRKTEAIRKLEDRIRDLEAQLNPDSKLAHFLAESRARGDDPFDMM